MKRPLGVLRLSPRKAYYRPQVGIVNMLSKQRKTPIGIHPYEYKGNLGCVFSMGLYGPQ